MVKIVHGGVSRNVVENFANVGMPVSFASMLEDTAIGRDVARHLENAGADLSDIVMADHDGIGMWLVILDENGDLAGSISCMPDLSVLEKLFDEHGDRIISKAENVVLEIDTNERIAERVFELAEKYDKKIYAIVGNLSVILPHLDYLKRTDCFICNEVECGKIFKTDVENFDPKQMLEFLVPAADKLEIPSIVVTMGSLGSVYYDSVSGEKGICPAVPTRLVDSCGAGDAFFSGTVMALTKGMKLGEAVKYGARLASMTIASDESSCPVCPDFFNEQLKLF
ncbi:MAG: carbohydrate kinase family protein [Oscillospiraceae bacterium]|nr:carbohydrate kinase family protein [Oscillospiraceae bacterium]